jgi:ElaA protein
MDTSEVKKPSFSCKHFRDLSLMELYQCMRIRQEVFVVEQDCPYVDADGKDLNAWHLMCWFKGYLVGYARLIAPDVSYEGYTSIGRVMTSKMVRKFSFGKQLMEVAIQQTQKHFPDYPIKLSAQSYLIRFYESFGFQTVGDEYMEDGIPHIAMILK